MQVLVKKAQKGDADDVADAMSSAVLSAFENITQLKKSEYFKTWLIRIRINICIQMKRERRYIADSAYTLSAFSILRMQICFQKLPYLLNRKPTRVVARRVIEAVLNLLSVGCGTL